MSDCGFFFRLRIPGDAKGSAPRLLLVYQSNGPFCLDSYMMLLVYVPPQTLVNDETEKGGEK